MGIRHYRILLGKVLLLLVIMLVGGLAFFGCATRGTIPEGWSGVEIADNTSAYEG